MKKSSHSPSCCPPLPSPRLSPTSERRLGKRERSSTPRPTRVVDTLANRRQAPRASDRIADGAGLYVSDQPNKPAGARRPEGAQAVPERSRSGYLPRASGARPTGAGSLRRNANRTNSVTLHRYRDRREVFTVNAARQNPEPRRVVRPRRQARVRERRGRRTVEVIDVERRSQTRRSRSGPRPPRDTDSCPTAAAPTSPRRTP